MSLNLLSISKVIKIFLLFAFGNLIECVININTTASASIIMVKGGLLLGNKTSQFPNEAFINFILYGHADVPFKYHDFLTSFGSKSDKWHYGYLVIGNDAKLGGVILETGDVGIPIQGGLITAVSTGLLQKYFPNNFTVLQTIDDLVKRAEGRANSTFNNSTMCLGDCSSDFATANHNKNFFLDNYFYFVGIYSDTSNTEILPYGYLLQYNHSSRKGVIKISCYSVLFEGNFQFFMTLESYDNIINFNSSNISISMIGSMMLQLKKNKIGIYNFTSIMEYE